MPELPEIRSQAAEMHAYMRGKLITSIDVIQPKSLNVPLEELAQDWQHLQLHLPELPGMRSG